MKNITRKITACLLAAAMCMGLCPGFTVSARAEQPASGLSDPRIVEDSSMEAGQKVTWDCVWFGSYPQAEVVPSADNYTAVKKSYLKDGDLIENSSLYNKLQSASGWDANNEITVDGNKYRRMKKSDATYSGGGHYDYYEWSDYASYHYFKYEPVKWRVLKVNGNQAFLLSDLVLDDQRFDTVEKSVTWETSTIRSWLNGYGAASDRQGNDYNSKSFIGSAFSGEERSAIINTSVVSDDNIEYGTPGNDTTDKIFFLSKSETYGDSAVPYGFKSSLYGHDEALYCKNSTYAKAMGNCTYTNNRSPWWLRSRSKTYALVYVTGGGDVSDYGSGDKEVSNGARPALNLNLSSNLHTYAGTVCSDGTVNETGKNGGSGSVDPGPDVPDTKGAIAEFTLDKEGTGSMNDAIVLHGTLKPAEGADVSKDFWRSEINGIAWSSSDPKIVDPARISCAPSTYGLNYSYAGIKVTVFPKAEGTAVITGKTAGGLAAECKIMVEETAEAKKDREFDESLYRATVLYNFYKDTDGGMNTYFNTDTPSKIIYSAAKENGLAASAVLWDTMQETLGLVDTPSGILDADKDVFTKKSMYEGIIFAIFQEASEKLTITEEEVHKNAKEILGVIENDVLAAYGIKISEIGDLSNAAPEFKEQVFHGMVDSLKKNRKYMRAVSLLQDALKWADTMDDLQTYAEHCANCIAIASMSDSHKQVLKDMLAACPADNPDLRNALEECVEIMEEQLEKFKLKIAGGSVLLAGKEAVKWGIDKMWEDMKFAAWSQCPWGAAFWAAYKSGSFVSDSIFHTSDTAEKTIKMSAMLEVRDLVKTVYEKEKAAFAGAKNTANAQAYLSSVDVFYNYLDEDCGTALSFTETVTESLAGKLGAHFGSSSGAELKKSIENIRNSYKSGYGSDQMLWLYELENDYPNLYKGYRNAFQALREKFYVHCPVDVYVKDSAGEVVASVVGNVPYVKEGEPFTVAADGDEKEIWVYGDQQYSVSYVGTGAGKMDITVKRYGNSNSQVVGDNHLVRTVKYEDIPLGKGTEYASQMNIASLKKEYQLKDKDHKEIADTADTADTDRKNYTLKLENAYFMGENGISFEGKFYPGEKVTVYAAIPKDAAFRGWKEDTGKVRILDSNQTMAVFTMPKGDVNMTAQYEKANGGEGSKKNEGLVSAIKLSGISKKIAAGKKVKLKAAVTPKNAANKAVTWTSSNPEIATVTSSGTVTMNKKSGGKSVTITAAAQDGSGVKATYRITSMKGVVKKVAISGKRTVKAGRTLKLKAKVKATKKANKNLKWISSNKAYATVDASGRVKAKKAGKGKKVKITAMATDGSGKKQTVTIRIK